MKRRSVLRAMPVEPRNALPRTAQAEGGSRPRGYVALAATLAALAAVGIVEPGRAEPQQAQQFANQQLVQAQPFANQQLVQAQPFAPQGGQAANQAQPSIEYKTAYHVNADGKLVTSFAAVAARLPFALGTDTKEAILALPDGLKPSLTAPFGDSTSPTDGNAVAEQFNLKVAEAVAAYRKATNEADKPKLEEDIRRLTKVLFLVQQDRRKAQLQEIEKRVEQLRSAIAVREEKADDIISARVGHLLGQPDPLGWDDPAEGAANAASPFAAPFTAAAAAPAFGRPGAPAAPGYEERPIPAAPGVLAPQPVPVFAPSPVTVPSTKAMPQATVPSTKAMPAATAIPRPTEP